MMKKIHSGCFSILLMAFLIGASPSAGLGKEIIIFGNHTKSPKIYTATDGTPKGVLIDIMRYIEKETGDIFHIELGPWKRSYTLMLQGKGGVIGLSKNAERLKIIDYSVPMYFDEMFIVVVKGKEFPFNSLEDLRGEKISVNLGASFGPKFEYGKKNTFKVVEVSQQGLRLKGLLEGNVDATLVGPGRAGLDALIDKYPVLEKDRDQFVLLPIPFVRDPNYLGFAKTLNMKDYLVSFNKALKKGWENGSIQRIIDNYSKNR